MASCAALIVRGSPFTNVHRKAWERARRDPTIDETRPHASASVEYQLSYYDSRFVMLALGGHPVVEMKRMP